MSRNEVMCNEVKLKVIEHTDGNSVDIFALAYFGVSSLRDYLRHQ